MWRQKHGKPKEFWHGGKLVAEARRQGPDDHLPDWWAWKEPHLPWSSAFECPTLLDCETQILRNIEADKPIKPRRSFADWA